MQLYDYAVVYVFADLMSTNLLRALIVQDGSASIFFSLVTVFAYLGFCSYCDIRKDMGKKG